MALITEVPNHACPDVPGRAATWLQLIEFREHHLPAFVLEPVAPVVQPLLELQLIVGVQRMAQLGEIFARVVKVENHRFHAAKVRFQPVLQAGSTVADGQPTFRPVHAHRGGLATKRFPKGREPIQPGQVPDIEPWHA